MSIAYSKFILLLLSLLFFLLLLLLPLLLRLLLLLLLLLLHVLLLPLFSMLTFYPNLNERLTFHNFIRVVTALSNF